MLERHPFQPFNKHERKQDHSIIFSYLESEKSLKMTSGGFLFRVFVYPYGSEKEIKFYSYAFSCIYENEKEKRLSSVCPQLESWWLISRMIIKGWIHALQASIHSLTLRLSPISVLDGEKGYRWMK